MRWLLLLMVAFLVGCGGTVVSTPDPVPLPERDTWVRPTAVGAVPRWGHKDGLSIGLWPSNGPAGLFRIYTPYLGHEYPRMINFVSIEPVAKGVRAQSELDTSPVTKRPGLLFTAVDRFTGTVPNPNPDSKEFATGRVETIDGVPTLAVDVVTERFRNGTRPVITALFRQDRPHEVGFRVSAVADSRPMDSCVLSATMGNYARLRQVWLADQKIDALTLWPRYTPDPLGFAPWKQWPRERILKRNGEAIVAATPNEPDPASAAMPRVPPAWKYRGIKATQYWRTVDVTELVTRVNARETFWGSTTPIPGGISFENFELEAPYRPGQEFWFGVTSGTPRDLGFQE